MPEIKERPILFSAPMVRAILEGRKTVTRRAVKFPFIDRAAGCELSGNEIGPEEIRNNCPYGVPGQRLWVRETWYCDHFEVMRGPYLKPDDLDIREALDDGTLVYAADGLTPYEADQPIWKPSIHMPRWASRILLEITDVRVERLQAGEGETAFESRYVAEGINRIHQGDGDYAFHPFKSEPGPGSWTDPFDAWRELWVGINGAESWNANPWVWVVEFKRVTP
ncbi:hypothetical protein HBO01_21215 [Pseudomonas rhodesiae]|uniref:hypothetical protein n=1 Tax=Pseudomonas rhodesiae TaxID=76760 RepID=UPI001474F2BE|nr:hypothetical protein [Pseudomonas rhodesiae]NMY81207.1 hypothetical protein [Pseudomonas rhodesiae]